MLASHWWKVAVVLVLVLKVGVVLFCEGWAVGGVEEVCDEVLV